MKTLDGYTSRAERAEYLLSRFSSLFSGAKAVLDVGCSQADLARHLAPEVSYVGIDADRDMLGDAHRLAQERPHTEILELNLEAGPLPFQTNQFDVSVCTEVLEHLDQFHRVFNDLVRVTRKHIIISLPNMYWLPLRLKILFAQGENGGDLKFYGLPSAPPSDRHRWFFSYEQAQRFMRAQTSCRVVEEFGYFGPGNGSIRSKVKDLFIRNRGLWPNLFAMSYWVVLEKK